MFDNPIGEVIEAATTAFVAQCLEVPRQAEPRLYDPPPLGAFVKIKLPGAAGDAAAPPTPAPHTAEGEPEEEDPFAVMTGVRDAQSAGVPMPAAIFALVVSANTSSMEPNRRPWALGLEEDEIRDQQPQIFELLRTEFQGLLIAHSAGDGTLLRRHLPPKPPRIHSRVCLCTLEETRALTADLSFLRGLLKPSGASLPGVPADELAAACLRQARSAHPDDSDFLLRAGRTLASLLAEDYERFQAILRNVL